MERRLAWDGCTNVRDLGGMPTRNGGWTAWRAVIRSDHPKRLSPAGRQAIRDYGIRTIVTLTTDGVPAEEQGVTAVLHGAVNTSVAVEDASDPEFAARWAQTGLW